MSRGRLEAFSDGVFAVAITLLALNLAVKGPGYGTLAHQLAHQWPGYLAYLISFFTIGIIWVNHHTLVANVAVVTRTLLFLNLVLLLFVVLIPVATGTVADYLAEGGFDAKLAVAVYGIVLEGMSLSFAAMRSGRWGRGGRGYRCRRRSGGRPGAGSCPAAWSTCWSSAARSSAPRSALGLSGLIGIYYIFERTPTLSAVGDADQAGEDA